MFFPAGSARGAPLVFPTLSENLGGFGQFERELEVAPFISPPTSVSGNIDLAGVSLHDLPTAEHEVQTNEQLPPTDLSRFAKS